MRSEITTFLALFTTLSLWAQQIDIPRIEAMPALTNPIVLRDYKAVTRHYDAFIYDLEAVGEYLPTIHLGDKGTNYPDIPQFYLDTYIGSYSGGRQAEAINILPSLVGATLVGIDKRDCNGHDYVGMSRNFFNRKNGQNVYLNGYSATSGGDWWYDVMPNLYFYQLYTLYTPDAYPEWRSQFESVASQWYNAVIKLGADIYAWRQPSINYRAFNLATGKPLASGVPEPESAGSIAWLLYKAYLETGDARYMQGAQLSLEALCAHPSNPSYELQLAYGAQAAAAMNAREDCNFYMERLMNWCFDRGPLRGWGMIAGEWGNYNVSGLIGEANDRGNDYAFVMNGFQQAAALAPVAKYDKRFARAIAKWMLHLAQASRLFYGNGLPTKQQEAGSAAWLQQYDKNHCLPFESMKERYNGENPFAMGDAVGGKWAATNVSLYSGSSVGYLAAVVENTDVEGVIAIDVNATDFFNKEFVQAHLYYNPAKEAQEVTVVCPEGSYDLYDVLTNQYLVRNVTSSAKVTLPADEAVLVAFIPAGITLTQEGTVLYAGDKVVDYNYRYNYDKTMRVNALAVDKVMAVVGETISAHLSVRNIPAGASVVCDWSVDGTPLADTNGAPTIQWVAPATEGQYTLAVTAQARGEVVRDSVIVEVVKERYDAPIISEITTNATMPASISESIEVAATVTEVRDDLQWSWSVSNGSVSNEKDGSVTWQLPDEEGVYTITCTATNRFGSDTKQMNVLVKKEGRTHRLPLIYYPLNGNTDNAASTNYNATRVGGEFVADSEGRPESAFAFTSVTNRLYTPTDASLNFTQAVSISCWFLADKMLSREQFVVSHGSWEERYKLSLTPEKKLRWTVNTSGGIVDVDSREMIEAGRFYQVVATYTGYSLELYIDGVFSNFAPLQGAMGTTSRDLCYGAKEVGNEEYSLLGVIDEIRLYDMALTPDDAATMPSEWSLSAVEKITTDKIDWYRNGNRIYVTLAGGNEIATARLYDAGGLQLPVGVTGLQSVTVIDMNNAPRGIYLLLLTDKAGKNYTLKFSR